MSAAAAGLLLDTLRLAGELDSSGLKARWAGPEAAMAVDCAISEGAGLWLYRRLKQLDLEAPGPSTAVLRRAAHEATLANLRIDAVTARVLDLLGDAGIPVVLIKGQARRALAAQYPWADAKRLSDVDLLLPEARVDEGWSLLRSHGFEPTFGPVSPFQVSHHRPVLHDHGGVTVELHVSTAFTLPAAEAWHRQHGSATEAVWEGRQVLVPSATELLWQAVAHGVEDEVKGWRLRAFLDAAVVLASGGLVDWEVVRSRLAQGEIRSRTDGSMVPVRRTRLWLGAAVEVAGVTPPAGFVLPAREVLHRTLSWRSLIRVKVRHQALRERLLEEGARVEMGISLTPGVVGGGAIKYARRRGSSLLARLSYRAWAARWLRP